jgi:hypothetical protein
MKTIPKPWLLLLAAAFTGITAQAANTDVEIRCVPKKVDEKADRGRGEGGRATTKENWVYEVTIENKTFKDLTNVEIKYVIFFKQEKLGSKEAAAAKRQNGTTTVDVLKPREKKVVKTDPVELKKSNLVGAYHYADGARPNAQDTLGGVWVRVFLGGQQFAEYANPSTLMREKWE